MKTKDQILKRLKLCEKSLSFFEVKLNVVINDIDRLDSQSCPDEVELFEAAEQLVSIYNRAKAEEKMLDALEKEYKSLSSCKRGSFSKSISHDE